MGGLLSVLPEKHVKRIRRIGGPNAIGGERFEHHRSQIEAIRENQSNQTQIGEMHHGNVLSISSDPSPDNASDTVKPRNALFHPLDGVSSARSTSQAGRMNE